MSGNLCSKRNEGRVSRCIAAWLRYSGTLVLFPHDYKQTDNLTNPHAQDGLKQLSAHNGRKCKHYYRAGLVIDYIQGVGFMVNDTHKSAEDQGFLVE